MEQWCVGKYRYSEVCDCMSLSLFSHISLCCSNQICFPALFFCVVLLSHRSSSLAEIIAVIVCVSVCVCVMEWSGALRWGDGMWNHWHYRSWRVEGVEVVAFPLCPLIDRRTPSTCHIPPHLHPPSSLSVQLSLLRAFVFSPPYFSSSSSSPPPAPLLATIAPSSHECQHPRDSADQSLSEARVLFIHYFSGTLFIFISRISHFLLFSLFLMIPFPSSCLVLLAIPLVSASLQLKSQWLDRIAVTAKKKKKKEEAIIKKERQNGGEIESNRKERQRRERERAREREALNINKVMGQM